MVKESIQWWLCKQKYLFSLICSFSYSFRYTDGKLDFMAMAFILFDLVRRSSQKLFMAVSKVN